MLHMAARAGAIEDIETLISGGANIDAIGYLGNTPLHQAAMFGQLKSIAILLKLKAKTTIRMNSTKSLLMLPELMVIMNYGS